MFTVTEKETGISRVVYAVDSDHFVIGIDDGFEFRPMSLFAPIEENGDAPAHENTQNHCCTVPVMGRHDTDLDAALADHASDEVPVAPGSTISTRLLDERKWIWP